MGKSVAVSCKCCHGLWKQGLISAIDDPVERVIHMGWKSDTLDLDGDTRELVLDDFRKQDNY